jgi:hypothetical protein
MLEQPEQGLDTKKLALRKSESVCINDLAARWSV